jgi:predicted RNA-binding protein
MIVKTFKALFPSNLHYRSATNLNEGGMSFESRMCESSIILLKNGRKEVKMERAARVHFQGDRAVCTDIIGEKIIIENIAIEKIDFMKHELLLRSKD